MEQNTWWPNRPDGAWYQSTPVAIAAIVFLQWVGIVYMWVFTRWGLWTKVAVSALYVVLFVVFALSFLQGTTGGAHGFRTG